MSASQYNHQKPVYTTISTNYKQTPQSEARSASPSNRLLTNNIHIYKPLITNYIHHSPVYSTSTRCCLRRHGSSDHTQHPACLQHSTTTKNLYIQQSQLSTYYIPTPYSEALRASPINQLTTNHLYIYKYPKSQVSKPHITNYLRHQLQPPSHRPAYSTCTRCCP